MILDHISHCLPPILGSLKYPNNNKNNTYYLCTQSIDNNKNLLIINIPLLSSLDHHFPCLFICLRLSSSSSSTSFSNSGNHCCTFTSPHHRSTFLYVTSISSSSSSYSSLLFFFSSLNFLTNIPLIYKKTPSKWMENLPSKFSIDLLTK